MKGALDQCTVKKLEQLNPSLRESLFVNNLSLCKLLDIHRKVDSTENEKAWLEVKVSNLSMFFIIFNL